MKSYEKMSDNEKQILIQDYYIGKLMSFAEIADLTDTYANRIRRDAIKLKIQIRNKSEAQKLALECGRHKHPTKGEKRSEEVKQKIGAGIMQSWENMSEEALNGRKLKAKENWDKLSEDEKANFTHKANLAVRKASDEGTKLEKYLHNALLKEGYRVEFHKEQFLLTTKLQIDLFLPTMNVAIEIDGPSHFSPIWGQDALDKNIKYDNKKSGLILGKGMVLIRIKQQKDFSKTRASQILDKLLIEIKQIEFKFPEPGDRNIEIGD
jgi:very-short-patch-repair endonuclease